MLIEEIRLGTVRWKFLLNHDLEVKTPGKLE